MKQNMLFLTSLLAGSVLLIANCTSSGDTEVKTAPMAMQSQDVAPDPNCKDAPDNWFPHVQTPDPAEGAGSPFADPNKTTNCDFHRWSWQKFLYLTKPGPNGKALFESLYQIDNELNIVSMGKELVLKDTTQAGGPHGVVWDRKNKPVYYSIYMNPQLYDFSQKWMAIFVKTGLGNLAAKGFDTLTYPVGCLEVKASWMLASSVKPEELKNYYITKARLGTAAGKEVDVALLGIHVVGRVANHPEFIWATFDHSMLGPVYDFNNKEGVNQVLSKDSYALYDGGKKATECRMNNATGTKPFGFKSIYQVYALGMAQSANDPSLPSAKDQSNNANIVALNKSVKTKLSREKGPWMNYVYTGSIWIDPTVQPLKPNNPDMGDLDQANLRGSRALGNLTMETFMQPDANITSGSHNCFFCHTTQDGDSGPGDLTGYNLAVSHVFTNGYAVRRNPKLKGTFK